MSKKGISDELTNFSGIHSRQEKILTVSYQQCFSRYEFLQQIFLGSFLFLIKNPR